MRELRGVVNLKLSDLPALKRHTLLFDGFYVPIIEEALKNTGPQPLNLIADFEFLLDRKVLITQPPELPKSKSPFDDFYINVLKSFPNSPAAKSGAGLAHLLAISTILGDLRARRASVGIGEVSDVETVPICKLSLPSSLAPTGRSLRPLSNTLWVGVDALPVPDDQCSWDQIIDFRDSLRDKKWEFRRFLQKIGTEAKTVPEMKDEIEFLLNQYTKEMEKFRLKKSISFMEAYIIPTVEVFESLKPSSFLKGLVAIKKRKLELLDGEDKALGRECAYVFDAKKRFGIPR
jgi:hypothetical protein